MKLNTIQSFVSILRGELPCDIYFCSKRICRPKNGLNVGRIAFTSSEGREAFTIIRSFKHSNLLGNPVTIAEIIPLTYTPQQIEIHLNSLGHPIVGDSLFDPYYVNDMPFLIDRWMEMFVDNSGPIPRVIDSQLFPSTIGNELDVKLSSINSNSLKPSTVDLVNETFDKIKGTVTLKSIFNYKSNSDPMWERILNVYPKLGSQNDGLVRGGL